MTDRMLDFVTKGEWVSRCYNLKERLAEAQAHNQELIANIFEGQVQEQRLKVRIAQLQNDLDKLKRAVGNVAWA